MVQRFNELIRWFIRPSYNPKLMQNQGSFSRFSIP